MMNIPIYSTYFSSLLPTFLLYTFYSTWESIGLRRGMKPYSVIQLHISTFSIAVNTGGSQKNFCTHQPLVVGNLQFCAECSQKQKRHWPELLENMQRCRWALLWGHWPPRLSWNMTGAAAGHCISDCSGPRCWSGGAAADDYITLVTRSTTAALVTSIISQVTCACRDMAANIAVTR